MTHLSDSQVQKQAESLIVAGVASELGIDLIPGGRINVGQGAHVQVDARSESGDVLVEAYARQGQLKGAQLKKVGQDLLKFALLRQTGPWSEARMVIAFASPEARNSVRGWLAEAAEAFSVDLVVVALSPETIDEIMAAQKRQVMVNLSPDETAALADPG